MGFIGGVILLIIIALIIYIVVTGGSQLCGFPGINLFCKCKADVPRVSGGDPDGNCWECPKINGSQTLRTGDAVTANTACGGNCGSMFSRSFPDIIDGGTCWTCPSTASYRTADAVDKPTACLSTDSDCAKRYPGKYGQVVSDPDGKCWACPPGKVRTIYKVDGSGIAQACGDDGGVWDTKVPAKLLGTAFSPATRNGPYLLPAKISKMRLF